VRVNGFTAQSAVNKVHAILPPSTRREEQSSFRKRTRRAAAGAKNELKPSLNNIEMDMDNLPPSALEPAEIHSWDDLDELSIPNYQYIKRGIYGYGFEIPSPIQKKAILPILSGKNVIAQAQSGTGKTGAFVVGMLSRIDFQSPTTQAMIISPTRELALQTTHVINEIGKYIENLNVITLVGGTKVDADIRKLNHAHAPPQIVVGCAGRICHMMENKSLKPDQLKLIILDEADELLSKGFQDAIFSILSSVSDSAATPLPTCQFIFVSATLPDSVQQIIPRMMSHPPITICMKTEQLTLEGISQYYIALDRDAHKLDTLKDLYSTISVSQCIIFCNSVLRVEELYRKLKVEDFPVCCIHSEMDKQEREHQFQEFKAGKSRVLLSTNITSRGIDIQQISIVINYDLPKDISTYLHRIGRSGRFGRKGTGINFVTREDIPILKDIERYYHCQIQELPSSFVN
jgi:superfamily II DNA/RNA helicase